MTTNLLGGGYVEVIPDVELLSGTLHEDDLNRNGSPGNVFGSARDGRPRVGRFGWKSQHASLRAMCADALANELGVPNGLYPLDRSLVPPSYNIAGSERIIDELVEFIRGTEPIARDENLIDTYEVKHGQNLFEQIGCASCHRETFVTLPPGTLLYGGTYRVPERLGSKTIHPYSDYRMHDVGTGDGIVQAERPEDADPSTANKFRTAPLWGLRYRSWLMHDGKSVTYHQAIERHAGEAVDSVRKYESLPPRDVHALRQFLNSL